MIGEDVIFPLTIPPGDVYPLFQLLLPTMHTRTPAITPISCQPHLAAGTRVQDPVTVAATPQAVRGTAQCRINRHTTCSPRYELSHFMVDALQTIW